MKHQLLVGLMLVSVLGCSKSVDEATNADGALQETASVLESTDEFRAVDADLGPRDELPGAALYATHCASCHNGTVPKAPNLHWLEMMTPAAIVKSLNEGVMQPQAAALSEAERAHIAEYITQLPIGTEAELAYAPSCAADVKPISVAAGVLRAGWGYDTTRFIPAAVAGLSAADLPKLELKWTYAFPGALRARSQPTVGLGALYVGSQDGSVYALDLETGCAHWRFAAGAEVRTGIVLTPGDADNPPLALFGDLLARLYAVNATTGELVWSQKVDPHPSATLTATPTLDGSNLIVNVSSLEVVPAVDPNYACCSFRGKTMSVDTATGTLNWEHFSIPEAPTEVARTRVGTPVLAPSGAPIWASATIDTDRNLIYVGTGENYSSPADGNSDAIIAIDRDTGERRWIRQTFSGDAWNVACMMADNPNCPEENGPDLDHGSSILLIDLDDGGQVLAAGLKDGTVIGLDPDANGKLLWSTKVGRGSIQGGVHFGMAAEGQTIYVPINDMNDTYNGAVLSAEEARPGVHALDAATGKKLWSHVQTDLCAERGQYCDPGVSAPVTAIPGAVIAGHLDGFLRAYDGTNGDVLWEFDTVQPFAAINGMTAKGGGMSGSGPAVANGYLIANSGYGLYFHEPGNLLAVFGVAD